MSGKSQSSDVGRYQIKEIFGPTLQGEGVHSGAACVFLRFVACNLACTWCDTDFSPPGSKKMSAEAISLALQQVDSGGSRRVIVTGGEPALQWDRALADALSTAGFRVHMETNGTRTLAAPVDWLTVSPKPQFHDRAQKLVALAAVDECKVVADHTVDATVLASYEERYDCDHWFVQPCDGDPLSLARALALIHERPRWRLSVQLHKIIGVP